MGTVNVSQKAEASEQTKSGTRYAYATLMLMTVTLCVLMVDFVETMVVPGIPVIQKDLNIPENEASWITSIVLIIGAAAAPLFGKLGDIRGKKKMFLISMGFYVVGVGLAGLSDSFYMLVLARGIQGVGFAALPLGMAMVTDAFPREKVATAQGIISGMVAVGTALGLVVGAFMVEDIGWHTAFYVAFALSLVMFLLSWKILRNDVPTADYKMDYTGTVILSVGIILILFYMTEGPDLGWTSPINLAILLPGLLLTAYFFVYEGKVPHPMIDLKGLRIRNVMIANLVGVVSGIVMFLTYFAVIYYAQMPKPNGLGLDVISTGLALAPSTVAMMIVAPLVGRLMAKNGPKPIMLAGALIMVIGFVLLILERGSVLTLAIDATVAFSGFMIVVIPMTNMVSLSLPESDVSVGLGFNSMLRNLGGAIGPILATTIMVMFTTLVPATSIGVPTSTSEIVEAAAFTNIFILAIVLTLIIAGLSLLVKNYVFEQKA